MCNRGLFWRLAVALHVECTWESCVNNMADVWVGGERGIVKGLLYSYHLHVEIVYLRVRKLG